MKSRAHDKTETSNVNKKRADHAMAGNWEISCHTIPYHTKPCNTMPHHSISRHIISCQFISRHVYEGLAFGAGQKKITGHAPSGGQAWPCARPCLLETGLFPKKLGAQYLKTYHDTSRSRASRVAEVSRLKKCNAIGSKNKFFL